MRTPDEKDIDDILSKKFDKFRLKQLKPLDTEHKRTQFFKNIKKKRPTINDIKPLRKLIEKGKCTGAILEHKHSFTWVHKNGLTNAKEKVYKCLKKGEVNESRSIVLFRKPEGKSEKLQFIIRRITKGCYVDTGEKIDEYYKVYWVKFNIRFHLFEDYPNKKVRDKLMQFKDKFMKGTMSEDETDSDLNEEQSSNIGKNSRKNKITTSSGAGENSNNEPVAATSGVKTRNASKLMSNLQRPEQDNIKEAIVDGNQNKFEDEEATDEIVKGNDKVEEQGDDINAEEEDEEDEDEDEDDEDEDDEDEDEDEDDEDEDDEDDDEELTEEDNKKMKDYFARIFIVNWINKNIPLCYNQNYNAARLMQKLCNEFGLDSVNKSNFDSDWFHIEQGDIQALFDQSRESLSKRLREQYALALSVVHCNVPDKQNFYLAIFVHLLNSKDEEESPLECKYLLNIRQVDHVNLEETQRLFNETIKHFRLEQKYIVVVSSENLRGAFDEEKCTWLLCGDQIMTQLSDDFIDKLHCNCEGTKPVSFNEWLDIHANITQQETTTLVDKWAKYNDPNGDDTDNAYKLGIYKNVQLVLAAKQVIRFAISKVENGELTIDDFNINHFKDEINSMKYTSHCLLQKAIQIAPSLLKQKLESEMMHALAFLSINESTHLVDVLDRFTSFRDPIYYSAYMTVNMWHALKMKFPLKYLKNLSTFYSNCMQKFDPQILNSIAKMACKFNPKIFTKAVELSDAFRGDQNFAEFYQEIRNLNRSSEFVNKFQNKSLVISTDVDVSAKIEMEIGKEGEPPKKKQKTVVPDVTIEDEFKHYMQLVSKIDTKKFTLSPIEFWWKNQKIYKKLSSIAYFYLSIPASCFPSEVMLVNAARNAKSILEDYSDDYSREQIISLIINKEFLREYFN